MNKVERITVAAMLALTLAGGAAVTNLMASGVQPGSSEDPLVTKSYVDNKINQLLGVSLPSGASAGGGLSGNQEIVGDVIAQIEFLYGDQLEAITSSTGLISSSYVPVSATAGQLLIGHEGTEIILRSGKGIGYCAGENGMVNVTTGRDVGNDDIIATNELLIVPRYDGRGVRVTSDAWFIVKGDYDLMD